MVTRTINRNDKSKNNNNSLVASAAIESQSRLLFVVISIFEYVERACYLMQ